MSICDLCKNDEELQVSHIIPNTFFKRMKKHSNQSIQLDMQPESQVEYTQESWSEKLLCRNCEQLINEFDSYVGAFTYNPRRVNVTSNKTNKDFRLFSNVDYKKLRLFQLSLIYRASLAQGKAYQHISLSETHMEQIRDSLLRKEPFSDQFLGCQMKLIWNPEKNSPFKGYVAVPIPEANKNNLVVYFIFGNFSWEFYLPKFSFKQKRDSFYVRDNGILKVPIIPFYQYPPIIKGCLTMFKKHEQGLYKFEYNKPIKQD